MINLQNFKTIQKLYYEYVQDESDPKRNTCPAPEILANLISNKISSKEKSFIISHILSCVYCSSEIKVLIKSIELQKSLRRKYNIVFFFKRIKYPDIAWKKKAFTLFAKHKLAKVTAILSFIVILLSAILFFNQKHNAIYGPSRGASTLSVQTYSPKINSVYSISALKFSWNEIEKTEYYTIEIFNSDLSRIWQSKKIHTNKLLPSEQLKILLDRSGKYYWIVTAKLISGISIESNLVEFYIK